MIKVRKHWDTLPRRAVEFHPSVEIFQNVLGRCLNVGVLVPIRKVEGQTRYSSEIRDPDTHPIFYASDIAVVFMIRE